MKANGPFTTAWSIPPWWVRDYPLVVEPAVQIGSRHRGPSLDQDVVMAPAWQGSTALVLGPGSWGFGIGAWPGTAFAPAPAWPRVAHPYVQPGPYGL